MNPQTNPKLAKAARCPTCPHEPHIGECLTFKGDCMGGEDPVCHCMGSQEEAAEPRAEYFFVKWHSECEWEPACKDNHGWLALGLGLDSRAVPPKPWEIGPRIPPPDGQCPVSPQELREIADGVGLARTGYDPQRVLPRGSQHKLRDLAAWIEKR